MDTDRDAQPQPDPHGDPAAQPQPFAHAGPLFLCVYDALGRPLARGDATLVVHAGPIGLGPTYALRFVHDGATDWGRGQLLPLPPHPDTDAAPDAYAQPDAQPRPGVESFVHAHKHAHHARAGEFLARTGLLVERYDHTHRHAHDARRVPDDRTYHDDHDH